MQCYFPLNYVFGLAAKNNNLIVVVITCIFISSCSLGLHSVDKQHGQYSGYGTYTYPDGSRYEGPFLYGKEYGYGTLILSDGKVSKVAFYEGKQIHTGAEIKKLEYWLNRMEQNSAENDAAIAKSNRADYQAILKDRKRRSDLTNSNAFRDGPNLTGGVSTTNAINLDGSNLSSSSSSGKTTDKETKNNCIKPNNCDDGGNSCEQAQVAYQGCVEGWSQDDWSEYYARKNKGNVNSGKTIQQ